MSVQETSRPKGLVIAAPNSNTGKTVFTLGLVGALRALGQKVEVAKAGPGFIDPQFLRLATGRPCYNLDKWALGADQLRAHANRIAESSDLLIIEGMMGMFDGAASIDGSTADIAAALELPVLLLVDASGQAQSIAALVHGFATLRAKPRVCGVVATRVGSLGHGEMLREAVDETGIPYLGSVLRSDDLTIPSRHLGLVQADEQTDSSELAYATARAISNGVDLEAIVRLTQPVAASDPVLPLPPLGQRIAVARDMAFSFAYPHLLDDWWMQGAEIKPFSPLANEAPDGDCDAVYLPGGYPELHCETLSHADQFLTGLQKAAARNAIIYGECGGYMMLGRALIDATGTGHQMAGLLDHTTSFQDRKMHIGYRQLAPLQTDIWPDKLRGHEFHWSTVKDAGTDVPLFHQTDARNIDLGSTGGRRGSVMGSYAHIIGRSA